MTKSNETITVQGIPVAITGFGDDDHISLTDIAVRKNQLAPKDVIKNWMRTQSTIEVLSLWEQLNTLPLRGSKSAPYYAMLVVMPSRSAHQDGFL